jgi:PAS domain S-box-containing protein
LLLEDDPADAQLIVAQLRQAGFAPNWHRVQTESDYLDSLRTAPDIILADHSIPGYDSLDALRKVQERGLDIPVIIVSGVLDDRTATECLRRGAADYLLKDRLARLGFSVRRVLEEKRLRQERRRSELQLRMFADLGLRLNIATSEDQAAGIIVEAADHLFGWDACTFDLYSAAKDEVRFILSIDTIAGVRTKVPLLNRATVPSGLARRVFADGALLLLRPAPPEFSPDAVPFGDTARPSASLMFAPIRHGAGIVGVLSIQSYAANAYTAEDLKTLQALAEHCGGALERIRAAETLAATQGRLAHLVASSPTMIYTLNINSNAICAAWVSENVAQITGHSVDEALQPNWWLLNVHPEDKPRVEADHSGLFERGRLVHDYRFRRKDGTYLWVRDEKRLLCDPVSKTLEVVGSWSDITERKLADEALKKSEAQYRALFENANDAILIFEPETEIILEANSRACSTYGFSREKFIGMSFKQLTKDVARGERQIRELLERGSYHDFETVHFRDDGMAIDVLVNASLIEFSGRPAILSINRDITDRRKAEEQIRGQARLLDLAQDAIVVRDMEERVIFWNRGAEQLYGWKADEIMGRKVTQVLFKETVEFERARHTLLSDGEWRGEVRQITRAGKEIIVNSRWTLVRDSAGAPEAVLVINSDITERRQLEAQIFRTQRIESIGTLAGGIAHDLNNILAPILIAAQVLRLKMRDEEDRQLLSRIETSAQRGGDVLKQLLTFARGIEGQRVLLQARHIARDIIKIINETFPKSISVEFDVPNELWTITGDATQLHQVLLNLCVNARDAMPSGGKLLISAENVVADEAYARVSADVKPGRYTVFKVEDSGTGIPAAVMDKIFEPFFTTKEAGKGTGLGLSTVLGIMKSHHGFIHVYSEEGHGSVFKVGFPATLENPAEMRRSEAVLPAGRGELVLVVDDEATIRDVTQKILARHGYRVLLAANGAEAMHLFAQHRAEVQLVLTDVMMPVMSGITLVHKLREHNPSLRIVASSGLSSGLGNSERMGEMRVAGVESFLTKPYTAQALLTALDRALSREPGAAAAK